MASSGLILDPQIESYVKQLEVGSAVMLKLDCPTKPRAAILADCPVIYAEPGTSLVAKLRETWTDDRVGWAVMRIPIISSDGPTTPNDIYLTVCWTPDSSNVKQKMTASSSKEGFKVILDQWRPGMRLIQVNGFEDLQLGYICSSNSFKKHLLGADNVKLKGKVGGYVVVEE